MTCFWDGILNRLTEEDFKQFNIKKPKNKEFVLFLKKHNQQTTHVSWNNESLTKKQLEENFTHVKDFDVNTIGGGYFCSTFEPFLFLVSQLFQVNLNHNYCGHMIQYRINEKNRVLQFRSNKSHFSV
uniref:Uncharacterized protein n=1 Tax=viral metagenome TaxID=1070528 RepID=A0A6C0KIY3_9ZZZZ